MGDLGQLLGEEGSTMRNARARAFAEALKEWDSYKAALGQKLVRGQISKEEYDRRLAAKARDLDL